MGAGLVAALKFNLLRLAIPLAALGLLMEAGLVGLLRRREWGWGAAVLMVDA